MATYPDQAIPLLIVGRQRAGTRFITDFMNELDEVTLQGELPNPVMRHIEQFMNSVNKYYDKVAASDDDRKQREQRRWQLKREQLLFALWANCGQSDRVEPSRDIKYYGYKRPNNEFYFDFYEQMLQHNKPRYVYCIRNFTDNYLSIVSRWPERDIKQVSDDYLASVRQYQAMKASASDRVFLFNLDDFSAIGLSYLERQVLAPLGLSIPDNSRTDFAHRPPINTAADVGVTRRDTLTQSENDFLNSHPETNTIFESLSIAPKAQET
ncbi:sulfotransferase [Hyphomonas johnsonii]|uniref:Sulfotransferase n=1 Tax=Hyphomonas johnsonii MHS-2 TaxID=1280950 RepID=A0A059FAN2_9PROT|nr:sulfotransferase [Hyphomonas johnsonii]KCZ87583.1 hypothetical protein HJO_16460 [Hyphomonas johnsonii MHS-2]